MQALQTHGDHPVLFNRRMEHGHIMINFSTRRRHHTGPPKRDLSLSIQRRPETNESRVRPLTLGPQHDRALATRNRQSQPGIGATLGEPMSFRELAEITHFHLFTMPVVFMILVQVLYLTNAGSRLKVVTTWISFGGVMLDLVSPWLISYFSPIFVLTMLTGDTLMTVGFLIMMVIPLYEMWVLNQPLMAGKHGKEA